MLATERKVSASTHKRRIPSVLTKDEVAGVPHGSFLPWQLGKT
jgi:hypothetical protein